MRPYYQDPTAWIAIANVERERKRKAREQEREKAKASKPAAERKPSAPVDVKKIFASEHKHIHINKSQYFIMQMNREIKKHKGENNGTEVQR